MKKGDWAWIQHMIAMANENGRTGIVIDNGCLFRGGSCSSKKNVALI
ncbi:MAG: N-6 DNA methylase [Archaeoglobaceae archaeon]